MGDDIKGGTSPSFSESYVANADSGSINTNTMVTMGVMEETVLKYHKPWMEATVSFHGNIPLCGHVAMGKPACLRTVGLV
jgi:hypothetical protein